MRTQAKHNKLCSLRRQCGNRCMCLKALCCFVQRCLRNTTEVYTHTHAQTLMHTSTYNNNIHTYCTHTETIVYIGYQLISNKRNLNTIAQVLLSAVIYIYIYIYTHTHTHTYNTHASVYAHIHIHIHIWYAFFRQTCPPKYVIMFLVCLLFDHRV